MLINKNMDMNKEYKEKTEEIFFKKIDKSLDYKKKSFYKNDAGMDLRSKINCIINPQSRYLVPTGISMSFPNYIVGLICPRSGLANKYGITILNSPGIIDSNYRGEVSVLMYNTDIKKSFTIKHGYRIAQIIFQKKIHFIHKFVNKLNTSERDNKGFGSTGL